MAGDELPARVRKVLARSVDVVVPLQRVFDGQILPEIPGAEIEQLLDLETLGQRNEFLGDGDALLLIVNPVEDLTHRVRVGDIDLIDESQRPDLEFEKRRRASEDRL